MNKEGESAATEALEKAVADRRAKAERAQQHLKDQLQKARQSGVARMPGAGAGNLATVVRDAEAKGVSGDSIACELGVGRLGACLWLYGFVPGLVVNSLCALLNDVLIKEAYAHKSIDGDSAAFFMMSLTLPVVLSAFALVICLAKGVRAAGSRGFWRTFLGYVVAALAVGMVLLVRSLTADAHLRLILYTN